jgi:hypothetical protein
MRASGILSVLHHSSLYAQFQKVSNRGHCIKVAVDFVAPESLEICAQLTREFRSHSLAIPEAQITDVLQLKHLAWHSWQRLSTLPDLERADTMPATCSNSAKRPHPAGNTSESKKISRRRLAKDPDARATAAADGRSFMCPACTHKIFKLDALKQHL